MEPDEPQRDGDSPHDAAANLSALIESTHDLIWSVDLDFRLVTFNSAMYDAVLRHSGKRAAVGIRGAEMLLPDRAALWPPMYRRALSEGPFQVEYSMLDGRILELAFNPIVEQGRKTGVSVFGKDITERKAAEKALLEAEKKYREIFEGALEGLYRTSPEGKLLAANPALAKMLGYGSTQELVSAIADSAERVWLTPAERSRFLGLLEEQGSIRGYECRFKRQDGAALPVSLTSRKVSGPDGRTLYYEGFVEDISERKRMEYRLRQSQEKFAKAFLSSPAVVTLSDVHDGERLIEVNEAFEEHTGYRRDEAIGRTTRELGLWADAREYDEVWTLLRSNGQVRNFAAHFRTKDGRLATGLVSAESIELDGRPCILSATIDISERQRLENALRDSDAKFVAAFMSNPVAASIVDVSNGRILNVNDAWVRTYGHQRHDAMGRTEVELGVISRETAEEAKRMFAPDGRLNNFEYAFRRKNGEPGVGIATAVILDIDGTPCALSAILDITERKQADEALRRSEEKFVKVFQSSPIAKSVNNLEEDGRFVDVNEAFERITGYRRDEVIGRGVTEIDLWADPAEQAEALRQLRAGGRLHNFEHRFRRKNGDVGTGLLSVDTFRIGGKLHAVAANIEITERKRAEEDRAKLEDQLRQAQKLESVGRLAGGLAHDFNNLLTVICGYAALMAKRLDPLDPLSSYLDEIRTAGERAAALTRQLLAFSRKQIIQPKPLDLNVTVGDSERMLRRLIGEDVSLTTRLDPSLGRVLADPEQIHQVIMNLAVNARDAMPEGGALAIATGNLEVSGEEADVHPDRKPGSYVSITVADNGSGMDENTRQQIFEPFFTTKDRDRGTGLGLSTVYGIVRQNGGWIDVSSKVGTGSTFKICFPRIDGVPDEEQLEAVGAGGPRGGETILVVEDQDAVRRFTESILKIYGYRILQAANAEEALVVAREYPGEIHMLLTDVVLPGIDGRELSERLTVARPTLKTLFTSGYSAEVLGNRGVLDSGVAYIPKPFTADGLALRVREVLTVA